MEDNTLVQTSFSATINAPIEKVDIPTWSFGLSESEYQSCSPAHVSAGATNAPDSAYVHQCRSTRPKPQGAAHPLDLFPRTDDRHAGRRGSFSSGWPRCAPLLRQAAPRQQQALHLPSRLL